MALLEYFFTFPALTEGVNPARERREHVADARLVQSCLTQGRQTLENRAKWNCWNLYLLTLLLLSRPFWLKFPPGWGLLSACPFPAQPLGLTSPIPAASCLLRLIPGATFTDFRRVCGRSKCSDGGKYSLYFIVEDRRMLKGAQSPSQCHVRSSPHSHGCHCTLGNKGNSTGVMGLLLLEISIQNLECHCGKQ